MMLATQFLSALPRDGVSPETTDHRQGYIHPHSIRGGVDRAEIRFIIRDFEMDGLVHKREVLRKLSEAVQLAEPRATVTVTVEEGYRNMGYGLKEDMTPVNLAYEAVRALGLEPKSTPTRGGTDGSRLTERGLPTPNIFNGSHNWHGPLEWVTLQDMECALQMCLKLVTLWAQKGTGYKGYQVQK
jgi:tripeptide aminopeptidase